MDAALLSYDAGSAGLAKVAAAATTEADDAADDAAAELASTLELLQAQFRRFGDPRYASPDGRGFAGAAVLGVAGGGARARLHAADAAALWHRPCAACGRRSEPGRLAGALARGLLPGSDSPGSEAPAWARACPRGHTPYSWAGARGTPTSPHKPPCGHTTSSWGSAAAAGPCATLLALVVRVRLLEASAPFRRTLLLAQVWPATKGEYVTGGARRRCVDVVVCWAFAVRAGGRLCVLGQQGGCIFFWGVRCVSCVGIIVGLTVGSERRGRVQPRDFCVRLHAVRHLGSSTRGNWVIIIFCL